jgi:hypothetical protein
VRVTASLFRAGKESDDEWSVTPIRPILVGSERPAFVDTPEPAAWQLALVGLGSLAWRLKKPSFFRS